MEKICGNCIHHRIGFSVCKKCRSGATGFALTQNCPDYKPKSEDKKMSNNYFMLDGKRIPMSDETVESLRKEQPVEWEFGDTADSYSGYTGTYKRVLLYDKKGKLNWFSLMGTQVDFHNDAMGYAEINYFTKTGNIFQGEQK